MRGARRPDNLEHYELLTVGEFELSTRFRFGGTPYPLAERSLRLCAKEILPVLHAWKSETQKVADAAK